MHRPSGPERPGLTLMGASLARLELQHSVSMSRWFRREGSARPQKLEKAIAAERKSVECRRTSMNKLL